MRVNELRCKEVVNVKDGAGLGLVDDVEFTLPNGEICAITVLGRARFFGLFGRGDEIYIKWCDIQKIGKDAVLVCIEPPNNNCGKSGFFSSLFK